MLLDEPGYVYIEPPRHKQQQALYPAPYACRSIPAFNPEVATIQKKLEDIAFLLRIPQRKPWGNMASDVAVSLKAFENRQQLLAGGPGTDSGDSVAQYQGTK